MSFFCRFIITYERELIAEPEEGILPVTTSAKSVDITKDLKNYSPFSPVLQSLRAAAASKPASSDNTSGPVLSGESHQSSKISGASPAETEQTLPTSPTSPTKVLPMEMSVVLGHGESLCVLNQLKHRMNQEVRNIYCYYSLLGLFDFIDYFLIF